MRAFLTGGSGFVGVFLRAHLEDMGDKVVVLEDGIDIAERALLADAMEDAQPEVVFHLAALTDVASSWKAPAETMRVNTLGTLAVLEAARELVRRPRVLLVSSAEVYGGGSGQPLRETDPVRPVTPYAASKAAAELLGLQAVLGRGLEVIVARPFNHVGPGQSDAFVVSALARRIVEAERADAKEIRTGNLDAARDFTDVRDVVRAYRMLAEDGVAGEAYNVASGVAVTMSAVLDELVELAESPVQPVLDPALIRPVDVPILVGDPEKLRALTAWTPTVPLKETLADVLGYWRARVRS